MISSVSRECIEFSERHRLRGLIEADMFADPVQSISEVQHGFIKAPEQTFGKPHPSRIGVKNACRIVVKVVPLLLTLYETCSIRAIMIIKRGCPHVVIPSNYTFSIQP